MNRQRKLIRRICTVGVVGVIAAGVITTDPLPAFTLDESAEMQNSPVIMEDNAVQGDGSVQPEEMENIENSSENLVNEENPLDPENTLNKDNAGNPSNSGTEENLTNPDNTGNPADQTISDGTGNPITPENGENNAGNPSNPEGGENPLNPENPEGGENPLNPENPGGEENPSNPENPGGENPSNPENPGGEENPSNPENPGGENPSNPENPGEGENPLNPSNPGGKENPSNPENPGSEENPSNPENPGDEEEPSNPENPDDEENPPDSDKPSDITDMDGSIQPGGEQNVPDISTDDSISNWIVSEGLEPGKARNAARVLNRKLVKLPKIIEDFRFWTVTRKYAFARNDLIIREEIPKEGKEDKVRAVGRIKESGLLYVLKEHSNGWFYVESGRVRGFVMAGEVVTGEEAKEQLEAYQKAAQDAAQEAGQEYTGIEGTVPMAEELIPWGENKAYTYLRATVGQTVIEKDYAITGENSVEVKENKDLGSRTVGIIPANGICYILKDKDQDWIYIESGDVRGFVTKDSVQYGEEITKQVEEKKEDAFAQAEKKVDPQENTACYYTLTSVKSGVPGGELRKSVVDFASQFIGNPYIWGGTSLTNGADCSGFVQSIFKEYGYDLPRVACDQAEYGTKIPVEDALPGDLIFYAKDGYINHVVMYAGEGKTIEAQSSRTGIVCDEVKSERAVWAIRFLKDNDYGYAGGGITDVNATPDMYGTYLGNYQLTYYCACELCCDIETGITATGTPVIEGRTIAVDPSVIPYGTEVIIGGHIFTAEDCGGAIKDNHIDIYVNDHATALALGVNYAGVYLKK